METIRFAWDENKNETNKKKHRVSFDEEMCIRDRVVVLCVTLIGGNSAKGVLEKYLDGVTGFDGAAIWENASVRVHGCDTKEECVAEQKEMKTQMEIEMFIRDRLQNSGEYEKGVIMIADAQALTDNADNPEKVRQNVIEVALDYMACGLDPAKSTLFIQSQTVSYTHLDVYKRQDFNMCHV